jgi:CheY-like chemotaxis protein
MKKIVLLVDDSSMVRHIVGRILIEMGHIVVIARDGQEACEMARLYKPGLIIMDVEMPVMDGIQATERIKADSETADIPILIFTSLGGEEDLRRAREVGCQGILNKPIARDVIQAEVEKFLGNTG